MGARFHCDSLRCQEIHLQKDLDQCFKAHGAWYCPVQDLAFRTKIPWEKGVEGGPSLSELTKTTSSQQRLTRLSHEATVNCRSLVRSMTLSFFTPLQSSLSLCLFLFLDPLLSPPLICFSHLSLLWSYCPPNRPTTHVSPSPGLPPTKLVGTKQKKRKRTRRRFILFFFRPPPGLGFLFPTWTSDSSACLSSSSPRLPSVCNPYTCPVFSAIALAFPRTTVDIPSANSALLLSLALLPNLARPYPSSQRVARPNQGPCLFCSLPIGRAAGSLPPSTHGFGVDRMMNGAHRGPLGLAVCMA